MEKETFQPVMVVFGGVFRWGTVQLLLLKHSTPLFFPNISGSMFVLQREKISRLPPQNAPNSAKVSEKRPGEGQIEPGWEVTDWSSCAILYTKMVTWRACWMTSWKTETPVVLRGLPCFHWINRWCDSGSCFQTMLLFDPCFWVRF